MIRAKFVAVIFTLSCASAIEFIPGNYKLTSDLKADDINEVMKAIEIKERDREMIRNWKNVELHVTQNAPEYKFSVTIGNVAFMERIYEHNRDYDDKMHDGRRFKAHFTAEDNIVIRRDIHPNFNLTTTGKFSKEGIDVNYEVDKSGKTTKAHQKFKRMGDGALEKDTGDLLSG